MKKLEDMIWLLLVMSQKEETGGSVDDTKQLNFFRYG